MKTASSVPRLATSRASAGLCIALAAAVILSASPAYAQYVFVPGASMSGSYFTNTTDTGYVYGNNANSGYNPTVGILSYSHQNSAHTLSGTAAMGSVKFFNEVVRTSNGTSRGAIAGGFQEAITISDPARTGHQGVFTGSLRIHMDQTVTGQMYQNLFGVAVAGSMGLAKNPGGKYAEQSYNWFGGTPVSLDHDLSFSIGFTFGTAFEIGVWMYSVIEVGNYGTPGTIQHNALNTLAWNGISSVQDTTSGTTVAPEEYTATGSQGGNFAAPIPEPSTALLAVVSGAGFLFRRRRAGA